MYYKNHDYTVWTEINGGCEKYYIKFHGQTKASEMEITFDIYKLYAGEFSKPLERQRNEKRRHLDSEDIEYYVSAGELLDNTTDIEEQYAIKATLETILKTCTETQQRRFRLYYVYGYSFEEIAKIENCKKQRIKKSVDTVLEKIKKYFF